MIDESSNLSEDPGQGKFATPAEHYNANWARHTYSGPLTMDRAAAVLQALRAIDWKDPPRMIDIGCGVGRTAGMLSVYGPTTGVDLSTAAIEIARARFPEVVFEAVDVATWQPPAASYDVAVSVEVIEHIDDQQAHATLLHDLLRPGGHLILTTPNARTLHAMSDRGASWSTQPIENWLTTRELRVLLEGSGFAIRSLWTVTPALGERGLYRLASSTKIRRAMAHIGADWLYDALWLRAGYGLHTAVLAQRD